MEAEHKEARKSVWKSRRSQRIDEYKVVVMGSPEDKVKLFDDDPKTPPPTTVVDENEEGSDFCQLTCVSIVFLVVFGVFFSLVIFPSSPKGEDSYYDQGLYISQHSFFSFNLPLRGLILGLVSRKFIYLLTRTQNLYSWLSDQRSFCFTERSSGM